jgi:hypothetical protein
MCVVDNSRSDIIDNYYSPFYRPPYEQVLYDNKFLALVWQFFLIPDRINKFVYFIT